ncbi:MAG: zinc ribbon domain-containing protein [Ruminococcaceae bacterium]|nr:zinc ribbon domain-containing protein [Oscillospiraceae bacterium]
MFCEKCGKKISDDALFCGHCGSPVPVYDEDEDAGGEINEEIYPDEYADECTDDFFEQASGSVKSEQANRSYGDMRESEAVCFEPERNEQNDSQVDKRIGKMFLEFFKTPVFLITAGLMIYKCIKYFVDFDKVGSVLNSLFITLEEMGEDTSLLEVSRYMQFAANILLIAGFSLIVFAVVSNAVNILRNSILSVFFGAILSSVALFINAFQLIGVYLEDGEKLFEDVPPEIGFALFLLPLAVCVLGFVYTELAIIAYGANKSMITGTVQRTQNMKLHWNMLIFILILIVIIYSVASYNKDFEIKFTFETFIQIATWIMAIVTSVSYKWRLDGINW